MDSAVSDLKRIEALLEQARAGLTAGDPGAALAATEQALAIDPRHLPALALRIRALEGAGQLEEAHRQSLHLKQLKREAWQREVEAELRGKHDVLGKATRHERH